MAWNSDPKVRDLGAYADKHDFPEAILIGLRRGKNFEVITYGKTAQLCKEAKKVGDQIFDRISTGEIEVD